MVQIRWDHLNRNASLLTKSQAIFLDGHFVIEHTARNRSGRFMHFNGTAGVWRRTTIDDAGGWQHDTLTEDLDLSYRAQTQGLAVRLPAAVRGPGRAAAGDDRFQTAGPPLDQGSSAQTCIKLLPAHPAVQDAAAVGQDRGVSSTSPARSVYPLTVRADAADVAQLLRLSTPRSSTRFGASGCSPPACSCWPPARPARSSSSPRSELFGRRWRAGDRCGTCRS